MPARQKIPVYDYEVVKGDRLNVFVRYQPGGNPIDWATADEVELVVRLPDNTEISIPTDRVELVDPGTPLGDQDPNIVTALLPSETAQLPADVPCTYQLRFVESTDVRLTILTGVITARYSAVGGA